VREELGGYQSSGKSRVAGGGKFYTHWVYDYKSMVAGKFSTYSVCDFSIVRKPVAGKFYTLYVYDYHIRKLCLIRLHIVYMILGL